MMILTKVKLVLIVTVIISTLIYPQTTISCSDDDKLRISDFSFEHDDSLYEYPKILETTPPSVVFDPENEEHSGKVVVRFMLQEDGVVNLFKTIEAPNEFIAQSVIDAIKKWKFEPAKVGDSYVPFHVYIQIDLPYSPDKISLWTQIEENERRRSDNSKK